MAIIYKILRADEWAELRDNKTSFGAPIDVEDGFIHFSTADTVIETANLHFKGIKNLHLLAFNDADFGDDLKYEKSRGGQLFPHLFSTLTLDGLLWSCELPLENGVHVFPENLS